MRKTEGFNAAEVMGTTVSLWRSQHTKIEEVTFPTHMQAREYADKRLAELGYDVPDPVTLPVISMPDPAHWFAFRDCPKRRPDKAPLLAKYPKDITCSFCAGEMERLEPGSKNAGWGLDTRNDIVSPSHGIVMHVDDPNGDDVAE